MGQELNAYNLDYEEYIYIYIYTHTHTHTHTYIYVHSIYIYGNTNSNVFPNNEIDEVEWLTVLEKNSEY